MESLSNWKNQDQQEEIQFAAQTLDSFHSALGMALQHSQLFSERLKENMMHVRLLQNMLKRAIPEDDNERYGMGLPICLKCSFPMSALTPSFLISLLAAAALKATKQEFILWFPGKKKKRRTVVALQAR